MRISVQGISEGQPIPDQFAFAVPHDTDHIIFSDNRNPRISWDEIPDGTRSLAILMVDPDVPSDASDVNQEGKSVSRDLPRVDFYHWVRVDIPAGATQIAEGEDSKVVTPRGKKPGRTSKGINGINGYTGFMAGDPDMKGVYGGYDGPCPPWNDELIHHYTFTVYALDVASLGLDGEFTGEDALQAMQGHILDQASVTGTYTLNPELL